jgi:predicted RNA binding protein YcfA (HicA-like mRNA interferase family)
MDRAPEHDTDDRTVSVPQHDSIRTGTLRNIMEQAGGEDFEEFCAWIDRNR